MGQDSILGGGMASWLLVILSFAALEEWPQWRGPHRDGQVIGFKLPAALPGELEKGWQVEVGLGHSSPVVADGKIYLFSRQDEDELLVCFNPADGKQLWRASYPAPYQVNPAAVAHGPGPKSTPTVSQGRVFTFGISGLLTCWDAKNGKRLWRRDFSKQFEKTSPLYGVAMSPLVVDDKCVVHVGGHDKGALMALDVHNGETIWSYNEDGPAYASPIIATLDDVRQVVVQTQKNCLAVRLEDGKLLWKIPFTTEYDQNSVTPVAQENSLIFSGINKGVDRYRVELMDDEWEIDKIWENREVSLYMSSPVTDGERLFGFSHRQKGQFFAIDMTTGKTLWTSEGRIGDNAALLETGKVLWALTTAGELIAFKDSAKQFEPLARYKVAESPTWAHPVLTNGGVLVKDEKHLTLWRFPKTPGNGTQDGSPASAKQ